MLTATESLKRRLCALKLNDHKYNTLTNAQHTHTQTHAHTHTHTHTHIHTYTQIPDQANKSGHQSPPHLAKCTIIDKRSAHDPLTFAL